MRLIWLLSRSIYKSSVSLLRKLSEKLRMQRGFPRKRCSTLLKISMWICLRMCLRIVAMRMKSSWPFKKPLKKSRWPPLLVPNKLPTYSQRRKTPVLMTSLAGFIKEARIAERILGRQVKAVWLSRVGEFGCILANIAALMHLRVDHCPRSIMRSSVYSGRN